MISRDKIEKVKNVLSARLGDDVMDNCLFLQERIYRLYDGLTSQYSFQSSEPNDLDTPAVESIYQIIAATELIVERSPKNRRNEVYKLPMGQNEYLNEIISKAFVQNPADELESADNDRADTPYANPTPKELAKQFAIGKKNYKLRPIPTAKTALLLNKDKDHKLELILVDIAA